MKWQAEPSWRMLSALEQVAREELAADPSEVGRWTSLIHLQRSLGDLGGAQASLTQAAASFGSDPLGRQKQVELLLATAECDLAIPAAEALVAEAPDDAAARELLGRAIVSSDRWGDAERRAIEKAKPLSTPLSLNQTWRLAETEADFRAIAARCRAMLAEDPIHTDARCFLAHSLAWLGEAAEARAVMSLDSLVRLDEASTGLDDDFRRALAAEVRRNPTLTPDPKNKATRNGLQTGRLGLAGESVVATLIEEIKAAAERYARGLAGSADPFLAAAPESVRLTQWAVVYGAEGYQTSHRHPSGWLSGVYYVSAPASNRDSYGGCLLLGAPQAKVESPPPWGVRRIEPRPGRFVLFPSFVTHATEPCGVDGERICVAFDVTPAASRTA